ncbi:hypothetical protein A6U87_26345 [Rhizobium sp. AC44/96]|uniref:hypothetical protein n=1 Tax=Rhizobium sp. AC44/96 TaxID=1841654 RepID=UPI00080F8DF5|nr:hypothetical protein [Rhizobium sp. AC44/96]OCJ14021.1 hypothetical protein A6U87_26345 [Rhizobium sp. AC44/96]
MLTPVRAASNASFSAQGQSASLNADSLVRAATAIAPVQQVETTDLNSAIAGKLSILLLAVRERMVEALLDALKTTADALVVPRDDAETNLVFASRLAEAIQKLPASKIAQIERQLVAQGHDIPVRLLVEALKNPSGPEAARVVAYLETMRYKDRDLVARAVNRSYGQNDAAPRQEQRAEISIQRENLPATNKATVPAQSERASETSAKTTITAAATSDTKSAEKPVSTGQAANVADARLGEKISTTTRKEAQQQLPEAKSAAFKPEDTDRIIADTAESTTPIEPEPAPVAAKADPIIPKSWAGIPASLSEDATDLIVAIIRDQESETLLEAADIDPAVDIDVILDDALIGDIPDELIRPSDQPVLQAVVARQASPLTAQPALDAAAINAAANRQTTHEADPRPADAPTIDMANAPVLMKIVEGVPYAPQPYQFAKDEADDSGSREMHREDHDAGPQSDEQEDEGDSDAPADGAADEPAMLADADDAPPPVAPRNDTSMQLLPAPGLAMPPVAEEAYALYRRMVGWE